MKVDPLGCTSEKACLYWNLCPGSLVYQKINNYFHVCNNTSLYLGRQYWKYNILGFWSSVAAIIEGGRNVKRDGCPRKIYVVGDTVVQERLLFKGDSCWTGTVALGNSHLVRQLSKTWQFLKGNIVSRAAVLRCSCLWTLLSKGDKI